MGKRDLLVLHPHLHASLTRILAAMAAFGAPMMVTDTERTEAEQRALFVQGRTPRAPGPVVTNVDGVVKKSNHQRRADGYVYAVDCAFESAPGRPSWDHSHPWEVYGALAEACGLIWGGRWKSPVDKPHIELPQSKAPTLSV